jgi:uncharacterized protein (TIGR03118 family)
MKRSTFAGKSVFLALTLLCFGWTLFTPAQEFNLNKLTADVPGAATYTDTNLLNPIGTARGINGPWWVADNGSSKSTLYGSDGNVRGLVVNLPSPAALSGPTHATGTVFNGSSDFALTAGNPASFLFVTQEGTILGWNQNVDLFNALIMVDRHDTSSYTGITIVESRGTHLILAADAKTRRVSAFDANYQPIRLGEDAFRYPGEEDLVPYNVQNIGKDVVVTFTRNAHGSDIRKGSDAAAIFDARGRLVSRLDRGVLDLPWGVAMAPQDFGEFSHMLLIANHGSGKIAAFDPFSGRFAGFMLDVTGAAIQVDGLWSLGFGDGGIADFPAAGLNTGAFNACFFTAGPQGGTHGLLGNITPVKAEQNRDEQ